MPVYPRQGENSAPSLSKLRRRVGMVFQNPAVFPCSIQENVLLPLRALGIRTAREAEERARQALCDVGLWEEVRDRLRQSPLRSPGDSSNACALRAHWRWSRHFSCLTNLRRLWLPFPPDILRA